jgi:hypothetical protein
MENERAVERVSLTGSTGVDGSTPPAHLVVDATHPIVRESEHVSRGLPRASNIDVAHLDVGGRLVGKEHVSGV